jgi:hypothetical protein
MEGHAMAGRSRKAADEPFGRYQSQRIEGWMVLVSERFLKDSPELSERTLSLLRVQLYQIVRTVPSDAVKKLQRVRIWVEENEPNTACMTYHPAPEWLKEHGVNPSKARCVELANARNFLAWTLEQPWMVLHELAHAYHHQFLPNGFENSDLQAAYDRAIKLKLYQSVLRMDGRQQRAYAATNAKEYFAELTEAYFGTNDQFPFVSAELHKHDPVAFVLMAKLWGLRKGRPRT